MLNKKYFNIKVVDSIETGMSVHTHTHTHSLVLWAAVLRTIPVGYLHV